LGILFATDAIPDRAHHQCCLEQTATIDKLTIGSMAPHTPHLRGARFGICAISRSDYGQPAAIKGAVPASDRKPLTRCNLGVRKGCRRAVEELKAKGSEAAQLRTSGGQRLVSPGSASAWHRSRRHPLRDRGLASQGCCHLGKAAVIRTADVGARAPGYVIASVGCKPDSGTSCFLGSSACVKRRSAWTAPGYARFAVARSRGREIQSRQPVPPAFISQSAMNSTKKIRDPMKAINGQSHCTSSIPRLTQKSARFVM